MRALDVPPRDKPLSRAEIVRLDRAHVWHPYTPMKQWNDVDPIVVSRAQGAWLEDIDGRRYLDGNSSWYVATLGHGHPRLRRAFEAQARSLDHCALAGIAHEPAARLARELVAIAPPGLTRVFYVDDGSTAVDAAVKMCVQGWRQLGAARKTRFLALDGAFHGDTVGATSLGGCDVFRRPFAGVTFECVHAPFPEAQATERAITAIEHLLREADGTIAAVFVEPMCQGAGGMRIYAAACLRELRALCDRYDAWLVADEVFTGYGRTGPMWACEHADVAPDLMCIGKAFSAIVPMGAVLASDAVFRAFEGDREHAFLHGHTFCGNPIGAALALEVLAIYRDEEILAQVARKAPVIARAFARLAALPGVARVRTLGMIGAADLDEPPSSWRTMRAGSAPPTAPESPGAGYLGAVGWRVYEEALKRGAYMRPLGSTVYVCPPLVIDDDALDTLLSILHESVQAALAR